MGFTELFSLRIAEQGDAPTLAGLICALAEEEGATPPAQDQLVALIEALIQTRFSDFLLAEQQGQPVGCLQVNYRLSTWKAAPYAYIEDLYLVPEARGQGIGHKLLDYACQIAGARGCVEAALDVRPENRSARQLYARYGFKIKPLELWSRPLPTDDGCSDPSEIEQLLRPLRGGAPQA
jgi:ribosomal protein S18 acetylase RimI-like enzyme